MARYTCCVLYDVRCESCAVCTCERADHELGYCGPSTFHCCGAYIIQTSTCLPLTTHHSPLNFSPTHLNPLPSTIPRRTPPHTRRRVMTGVPPKLHPITLWALIHAMTTQRSSRIQTTSKCGVYAMVIVMVIVRELQRLSNTTSTPPTHTTNVTNTHT